MKKRWLYRLAPLFAVLLVGFFTVACGGEVEEADDAAEEMAEEAADDTMAMEGLDAGILADPGRPAEEVAQDADRKPLEVYEFVGIEPGMTVADLWPGGGYNTFLLSRAVGDSGAVYAALDFYNSFQDGAIAQRYRDRVATDGLANVTVVDNIADIPAGSLDAAIAVRNYHDVYGFGGDPAQTVADIHAALKPGGVIGIIEVAASGDGWDEETHRLGEATVIADFTGGGFELVESSDMLANPDDDRAASGFNEGRQTMDRYLLKFRKVEGGTDGTSN